MVGAILGDIIGSRHEFHNIKRKNFELFTDYCEFTDDTVMTIAVASALMRSKEDYSDLSEKAVEEMRRIGQRYPDCGYGGMFGRWMFSEDPKPYNSFGNGSAMRISPVGFMANSVEEAKELSRKVTEVTHNHPEGIKGAEAIAVAIVMARQGKTKREIMDLMDREYYCPARVAWYRKNNIGHGSETCMVSVPQALACFYEGRDYEDVIRNCISIGGDSDTIAAIAGGLAEAYFGIPERLKMQLGRYLDKHLMSYVNVFEMMLDVKLFHGKGR